LAELEGELEGEQLEGEQLEGEQLEGEQLEGELEGEQLEGELEGEQLEGELESMGDHRNEQALSHYNLLGLLGLVCSWRQQLQLSLSTTAD
jgi:hypothetical protein